MRRCQLGRDQDAFASNKENAKMKRITLFVVLLLALVGVVVMTASAVSGANFTTFNAHVDGSGKDVCKNTAINCNIYGHPTRLKTN